MPKRRRKDLFSFKPSLEKLNLLMRSENRECEDKAGLAPSSPRFRIDLRRRTADRDFGQWLAPPHPSHRDHSCVQHLGSSRQSRDPSGTIGPEEKYWSPVLLVLRFETYRKRTPVFGSSFRRASDERLKRSALDILGKAEQAVITTRMVREPYGLCTVCSL